jgi:hypothetical protein
MDLQIPSLSVTPAAFRQLLFNHSVGGGIFRSTAWRGIFPPPDQLATVCFTAATTPIQPDRFHVGRRRFLRSHQHQGVDEIEAALEFGAAVAINLGVASGGVEIKASTSTGSPSQLNWQLCPFAWRTILLD